MPEHDPSAGKPDSARHASLRPRRRFLQWLTASLLLAGHRPTIATADDAEQTPRNDSRLRVAAIQMTPKLGDVDANLAQAEQLVREATRKGAQWIDAQPHSPVSPRPATVGSAWKKVN